MGSAAGARPRTPVAQHTRESIWPSTGCQATLCTAEPNRVAGYSGPCLSRRQVSPLILRPFSCQQADSGRLGLGGDLHKWRWGPGPGKEGQPLLASRDAEALAAAAEVGSTLLPDWWARGGMWASDRRAGAAAPQAGPTHQSPPAGSEPGGTAAGGAALAAAPAAPATGAVVAALRPLPAEELEILAPGVVHLPALACMRGCACGVGWLVRCSSRGYPVADRSERRLVPSPRRNVAPGKHYHQLGHDQACRAEPAD